MEKVRVQKERIILPTYIQPPLEDLPMFAQNRVHQRTSGNPYPNKVAVEVSRKKQENKEYVLLTLENEYLKLGILPELGGKVYSAYDKTAGYDFFYKQHVIKPALIGVLGYWTSGGLEFNWPYHHRASSFMPTDYFVETAADGSATVWLSEYCPDERMKGMVGIRLNAGMSIFETVVKLDNTKPTRSSFLWWENAAVPVNPDYEIFFPPDVDHVFFHYKRSITTYPVASNAMGIYNGIRYETDTDISKHKNTKQPTSYFSADSEYDFFGGYDNGKDCGVVHVASHHISPGKKCFTWAYNQLSKSWERALTDADGEYCELMAGCYSDNQPDFSWIEPYESKRFSQYWYPISKLGVPDFANRNGAICLKDGVKIQATQKIEKVTILIKKDGKEQYRGDADLAPDTVHFIPIKWENDMEISVMTGQSVLMNYMPVRREQFAIPEPTKDMPNIEKETSPQTLFLEGTHVLQYRDPCVKEDAYFYEALKRQPDYIPALKGLGEYHYKNFDYAAAENVLLKALRAQTRFNKRTEDGDLYYLLALVYRAQGRIKNAYDYFYKASWNYKHISPAMTQLALLDCKGGDYITAAEHVKKALSHNADNALAGALSVYVSYINGDMVEAKSAYDVLTKKDELDHLLRFIGVLCGYISEQAFLERIQTDINQIALDLCETLLSGGFKDAAIRLLDMVKYSAGFVRMTQLVYADLKNEKEPSLCGEGIAFPSRQIEYQVLKGKDGAEARYLLGCLLYSKRCYGQAATLWENVIKNKMDFRAYRNLAVAYYSHLGRQEEALTLLETALNISGNNQQLLFEYVYIAGRMGVDANQRIKLLEKGLSGFTRDELYLELARAYTMNDNEDAALQLLEKHQFIPCEGGEHHTAEQYIYAHLIAGRKALHMGDAEKALQHFISGQTLPDNLGAGLWHEVKLVPLKYFQAEALLALGREVDAEGIFRYITSLTIDYFSDMHLKELIYYQACSYRHIGQTLQGNALMNRAIREWSAAKETVDAGFFSATPFFISYIEDAKKARTACYAYLLALSYRYVGEKDKEKEEIETAYQNDRYALNVFAERLFT